MSNLKNGHVAVSNLVVQTHKSDGINESILINKIERGCLISIHLVMPAQGWRNNFRPSKKLGHP